MHLAAFKSSALIPRYSHGYPWIRISRIDMLITAVNCWQEGVGTTRGQTTDPLQQLTMMALSVA